MQIEFIWDEKKNATKKEFQYYWNERKGDCL